MIVELTQFVRPHGHTIAAQAELPDSLSDQYAAIIANDCRLTAEMLTTGEVSMCIEHPEAGDFDIRVVPNGPEVPKALADLVGAFKQSAYRAWYRDEVGQIEILDD